MYIICAKKVITNYWLRSSINYNVNGFYHPFIRSLFTNHTIIPLESKSGMSTEKGGNTRVTNKEVVILNYPPPNNIDNAPQITRVVRKSRKVQNAQQHTLLGEFAKAD